jgi:K+-transporting ATPase ATPase C chain
LSTEKRGHRSYSPIVGLALLSLLICGLFFPLLVTGIAQASMPFQANGEIVWLGGHKVGSNLIDNNFTLPIFFHSRSDSASGVDPDITLQDAYSQIPRIQNSTGIDPTSLKALVDRDIEGVYFGLGSPYVNTLRLNLDLIRAFPSTYTGFG